MTILLPCATGMCNGPCTTHSLAQSYVSHTGAVLNSTPAPSRSRQQLGSAGARGRKRLCHVVCCRFCTDTVHGGCPQTNTFQLQLLTNLQSDAVPTKVLECLRDARVAFEAATLEDLYVWFDRLRLSDDAIFTCIGTSGPQVIAPCPCLPAARCPPFSCASHLIDLSQWNACSVKRQGRSPVGGLCPLVSIVPWGECSCG